MEIRFTFCFRFQYVKERLSSYARSGNPRAWTSVPGRFPSFLPYGDYMRQRVAVPFDRHTFPSEPRSAKSHVICCLVRCSLTRPGLAAGLRHSTPLQKGGVPAAPSGTATLLRLSPNHQFCLRPILAVTDFRHPRLSWLDGRCVQGPGTYSPRHG